MKNVKIHLSQSELIKEFQTLFFRNGKFMDTFAVRKYKKPTRHRHTTINENVKNKLTKELERTEIQLTNTERKVRDGSYMRQE